MLLRSFLQTHYSISRREFTRLIDEGEIFINGEKIKNYNEDLNKNNFLEIGKYKISKHIDIDNLYIDSSLLAFNKPEGYTCSKSDTHNKTFYEILPKEFKNKYYYIGRLDKNSHGLMLLTSDPKLVNEFEHPSKEILKKYHVTLDKNFDWKLTNKILKGIYEGGELLRTKSINKLSDNSCEITLNEGKKRHIRRIFKALGYNVIDLKRISIGKYQLGELKEGEYKKIKF